ncbi:MAG: hypothetical protein M0T74_07200 [Desulfitobacterium hafniense]|nr:hypothetical protein [Desulfitobacterium hafniense]
MTYNFEVKEAVWLGTALMSYAKYLNSEKAGSAITQTIFWFEQNEIREFSQTLTNNTIQPARTSQWFNGDHENNSYNYLRANGSLRRLTGIGEFKGIKERPDELEDNLVLDLSCLGEPIKITIFDLLKWVQEIYSPCVLNGLIEITSNLEKSGKVVNRVTRVTAKLKSDIDKLIKKIDTFYREIKNNEHARYKSWEHCYAYFQKNRKTEECIEIMALHLGFYLASWGMYRGSTFLLQIQKDYKIHIPIIKLLMESKYDPLCAVSADKLLQTEFQDLILELKERMTVAYGQKITDTLITKILLGTLGCTPAYDRYFNYGIRNYNVATAILNRDSLIGIASFYLDNYDKLERKRSQINSAGIIYPQMKIVDMCFWQVGFDDDSEKRNGENDEYPGDMKKV